MNHPRPVQHLITVMRQYPELSEAVNTFRAGRGDDLPDWPDWCFMPMAAWYAIVSANYGVSVLNPTQAGDVSKISAIGTWRYSQGIYQFDPSLLAALVDSPISGAIPCEVLQRLPEWCLYIETPGQKWFGDTLHGFWAHLEWDVQTEKPELRFLFDCEESLIGLPIHMGPWTITEALDRAVSAATMQAAVHKITFSSLPDEVQDVATQLNPLVSILLYLCSEEPEIQNNLEPGSSPARPMPKKTKRGLKFFPPDKSRVWAIGTHIGILLRQAATEKMQAVTDKEESTRSVKAHLRRGHWHGYWTGTRQQKQKFVYKWIYPLIVGK